VGSRSRARARAKASETAAAVGRAPAGSAQVAGTVGVAAGRPGAKRPAPGRPAAQLKATPKQAGKVTPKPAGRATPEPAGRATPEPAETADLPRPVTITIALGIEALEAVLVLVAAGLAAVDTGSGKSYELSGGIAITVIGLITAGLLGLVAYGLRKPRRWTRTPALLTQLFVGSTGLYLLQGGRYGWGAPAMALALAGFAALLAPPSTRALTVGLPQPADRHKRRQPRP
jgi:hypothetical protein